MFLFFVAAFRLLRNIILKSNEIKSFSRIRTGQGLLFMYYLFSYLPNLIFIFIIFIS